MSNLQFSVDNQGVAILGSEYCSGYIDSLGKWNTGFYCPSSDETVDVFCCGSSVHKYCCTKKDQVIQEELEGLTVVIGVLVGASTALLLLAIVFCVCCPWCQNYRRKKPDKSKVSVYRPMHPHSSASGATINYSGSWTPITPSQTVQDNSSSAQQSVQLYSQGMSHCSTLPHNLSQHSSFRMREELTDKDQIDRQYSTLGRHPREQPPAYHILPRSSYLLVPQDTPDLLCETKIQEDTAYHSLSQSMVKVNMINRDNEVEVEEEETFQSTKF